MQFLQYHSVEYYQLIPDFTSIRYDEYFVIANKVNEPLEEYFIGCIVLHLFRLFINEKLV